MLCNLLKLQLHLVTFFLKKIIYSFIYDDFRENKNMHNCRPRKKCRDHIDNVNSNVD